MAEENKENTTQSGNDSANIFYNEDSISPDEKIMLLNQADKYPLDDTIDSLNGLLNIESDPKILQQIIRMLGKYKDESSIGPLVDLLLLKEKNIENCTPHNDEITKLRCAITKTLASFKNQKAVPTLLFILNNKDENYTLRLSAAESLGKIGDKYAVASLIDIVANESEKSVYLRESAAKALGMLGDIRAIDPFIKILESKKGIIDKFTFLKERVIESISKIGYKNDKILKALSNSLMDESSSVRLGALEALSEIDDMRVIPIIEPLIKDEEEEVARMAINALYNINGRTYIESLLNIPDLPGWCRDEIETILREEDDEY